MIRKELYRWLLLVGILFVGISCTDDDIVSTTEIGKGEALVQAEVSFKPFAQGLNEDSRTPGNAIREIQNLCVLVYDEAGTTLLRSQYYEEGQQASESQYKITEEQRADADADNGTKAEDKTEHAEFKLKLPYGVYRIYAVANMGNLADTYKNVEALKSISLNWQANNISANNQMFGCFTVEGAASTTDEKVVINQTSPTLHAWIKRAASKVTVAFDGNNLNENVYIYIHSVQIKDIPASCYLGNENKPAATDDLISEGEKINYRAATSTANNDGLIITKGAPTGGKINSSGEGGVHHEAANALFFYENMAGTTSTGKGKWQDENKDNAIDYPNGNTSTDPDYKDGVKNGTYIEVKGYYVNKNIGKASQGEITYRFMMGKDVDKDCNAERNYHYKLTLMFKNDANNPDWHIVYEPENPSISVPTPLYISYGYNESINIPVVVRGASVDESTTIKATITENPWGYPEHKYYENSNHDDLNDGFLIFASPESAPIRITEAERNSDWPKDGYGHWDAVKPTNVDGTVARYDIPVYTRPLILGNSLTGHNPYVSYERKAKVKFGVTLDGQLIEKEIEVIQVKRLVNPTGVWRSDNNTTPFNVRLMELNEPDTGEAGMIHRNFYAPKSDGPWTAHIEKGASWVRIAETGSNDWGTDDVVGGTGSEIRFDYKPEGVNTTGNVRCGVIKVTYHNNNCVHYVFVSQGNGTVNLKDTKWQNRNVQAQYQLVDNPLMEGSMFKFGNPWYGILVENNYRDGYGFDQDCWGKTFVTTHNREEIRFDGTGGIGYNLETGFTGDRSIYDNTARPATYEEWKVLEDLPRRYGVLYGDECTETKATTTDAYSYWKVSHERGMQGMFVWDNTPGKDGNHIFFPIGSTGYGHRKVNDNAYKSTYGEIDKYSLLKYAQRPLDMPEATAMAVPMYYDLWIRKGAIYWYNEMFEGAVDNDGVTSNGYGHDINFHTMLLQTYGANAVGQSEKKETDDDDDYISTDACYIRCVEP